MLGSAEEAEEGVVMEEINLYPFQETSVEKLREGIRAGHRAQALVAPTGSGKTVIATHMLKEALAKGSSAAFVVDRLALCDQASKALWKYGVRHGIAQGENTINRREPIQVCSAQTIEKRGFFPDMQLLVVDEAHAQRKFITEFAQRTKAIVIGLTATPFSPGMGDTYSNMVNVVTTNQLIQDGYLAPLKVYAAKSIDMAGAKVVAGEWTDKEIETRGKLIIGDIVSEWIDKTTKHFGGPVKTLVFSATVDHGADICRQFQEAGYDFRQVSYKDGNGKDRKELIDEFREKDSKIIGLVSCEALAKGFDVEDVLCGIGARPYRKSFSGHIQMIGRAMRRSPGKTYALWLDHCGNYVGFLDRMNDLFEKGVHTFTPAEDKGEVRDEKTKEKTDIVCSACGFIMAPYQDICPSCGKVRVRKSTVEIVPGQLFELDGARKVTKPYLQDREEAWRGICLVAINRKKGDIESAKSFALAQYRNFYNAWPHADFDPGEWCDPRLASHITANLIRYAKSRKSR